MVVTDDDALADRLRTLKDLAHSPQRRFWHEEVGFNYRMTNLQAALGLGQLESIEMFLERKRTMADRYTEGLNGIAGLQVPVTKEHCENVFWMYVIVLSDPFPFSRDAFRIAMKERGVDTRDFFYPLHQMPLAAPFVNKGEQFPVTDSVALRGCYLPSGLAITDAQIDTVIDAVRGLSQGG